jgi:hypothetical protein
MRSESRCAIIKVVGSDVHGSTMLRLDIATHAPKCIATFRTHGTYMNTYIVCVCLCTCIKMKFVVKQYLDLLSKNFKLIYFYI